MQRILHLILERIGRARGHVQSRLILRLVAIAAFDRENAMPVRAAAKADGFVRANIFALQRRITCRVTIDASRMAEDLERFDEGRPRIRIVA